MAAENPSTSSIPLVLRELTVRYGDNVAVRQLNLTVRAGEIYGLLGSNGAGKSSTIKCVVGLVPSAGGDVRVFGRSPIADPLGTRRLIGYVPETTLLFDALTPREFLEFVAGIRGMTSGEATARVVRYITAFQIQSEYEQPIATLSMGTRQKVLVIAAMLHQPQLLVLDEPFSNLDPRTVRIMKELLTEYVRGGERGILFSTHTMEVAELLCDRVGILDHGQLKGEGTVNELRRVVDGKGETLEEIYLRLTVSEEGVREAVRQLTVR
ncbi:MAG: ABC transporter ATP-binding protein [Thermoplasmata archaeon]|nr:ABC transporter ATP-binding protein [Thermoplasmata archaeon]